MWPLILDSVAPLVRLDRSASQRKRLRRAADWLDEASEHGAAARFRCEPWRFAVPESVLVDLAWDRGYRLRPVDGRWSGRDAFCFERASDAASTSAQTSSPGHAPTPAKTHLPAQPTGAAAGLPSATARIGARR